MFSLWQVKYFVTLTVYVYHGWLYLLRTMVLLWVLITRKTASATHHELYNKINQLFFINLTWENPARIECHITNLRNSFTIHILYTWRIPVRHISWPASVDKGGLTASLILSRREHKQNHWILLVDAFEFACLGKILGCYWVWLTGLNPE
jgi:hypothetical protein